MTSTIVAFGITPSIFKIYVKVVTFPGFPSARCGGDPGGGTMASAGGKAHAGGMKTGGPPELPKLGGGPGGAKEPGSMLVGNSNCFV